MDFVTIATTGNATDFGDFNTRRRVVWWVSDSHGGIGNERNPSLETATSGSIRFNTDSSKLEIYNGEQWFEIDATSPEEQTGGTRGIVIMEVMHHNQIE